jgi:ribose 1,5-bisphosphokinase PhnN
VVVFIGPSGSGKSSVVRHLHHRGVLRVHPTWTTRPRRSDETTGSVEHRFVSDAAFDALCRDGFFLETGAMFGLPYRYGLPRMPERRRPDRSRPADAVMLRAPVLPRFSELVPHRVVYQIDDLPQRVAGRLQARAYPPAELQARLDDNRNEVAAGRRIADRIFLNAGPVGELADRVAAALVTDGALACPVPEGATR